MPSSYSIGDHYEAFAKKLVASGRYASVSEVLRDGLRLMEEREGIDSGFSEYTDSEDIKSEGRRILAERQKSDAA
jgi:antitoxin ParD1/3/4